MQNNYGAALGGPVYGKRTFFFVNYEGYRRVAADAMTDTVPTEAEMNGDFSQSGVTIYDPETTAPNPDFNPALPVSKSNPASIRQPFPNNVIPASRINSATAIMLKDYVPRPNMMDMGSAMTHEWAARLSSARAMMRTTTWTSATRSTTPTRARCALIATSTTAAMRFFRYTRRASTDSCRRICPASATSTTTSRSRAAWLEPGAIAVVLNTATLAISRLA